jgi:hypothetical protein
MGNFIDVLLRAMMLKDKGDDKKLSEPGMES